MAYQRRYVPPHRRPPWELNPTPIDDPPSSPHIGIFDQTILERQRHNIHTQSRYKQSQAQPHDHYGRLRTADESQAVPRGRGEVRAPSISGSISVSRILGIIEESKEDEGEGEEDLNKASAQYSISTSLARRAGDVQSIVRSIPQLPAIRVTPPAPPVAVAGPALIERTGPRYIPPIPRRWPQNQVPSPSPSPFITPSPSSLKLGSGRTFHSPNWTWNWRSPTPASKLQVSARSDRRSGPSVRRTGMPSFTEVAVLFDSLGEAIVNLQVGDLIPRVHEGIKGVEYAGSYKWIDGEEWVPTLAVPAVPDIWDPPRVIGQLGLDKHLPYYEEFPDYASALLPPSLSTLEPLFLSLETPAVLGTVNLVTGRNNLRKLWSALCPADNHHTQPFRIDLEYIPDPSSPHTGIVLFERWEPPQQRHKRQESPGYHLAYHEAATKKVLVGSDRTPGCNRVIRYSFGGLGMLVKYDISAYIPLEGDRNREIGNDWDQESLFMIDDRDTETSLSTIMEGLDFDDPVYNGQAIQIKHTNLVTPPQSSLVAVKTKTHQHAFDEDYHFSQMYFSQTSKVIYARHTHGNFSEVARAEYNVTNDTMVGRHQVSIDKMGAMLRWLVGLVKEQKGPLGLVWDGRRFTVCERQGGPQLSAPVKEMIAEMRRGQEGMRVDM